MEALILEPSLYTVKAILILDNDGDRLFAKYYDDTYPSVKEQKAFEKNIFNKTHRTDSEIALLEGLTVVYKSSIDLYFYVIGSSYENELMLMAVLNCLFDSLSQMLRKNVEKRALLENMEGLFLAVDEIVDGGVILESDPQQVVHRVALRGEDVPLTEQTVSQEPPCLSHLTPTPHLSVFLMLQGPFPRFYFVLSNHGLGGTEGTACSQSSITANMTHIPPPVSAQHLTCSTP
ncbi:coatomer subunit zeta-1 isoform X2 [Rousettus aegyptiacus]|uniref:coatomer subunit zeta-1 isoform X2 n=1 Tax=Rousettus aegyptiacus TaxID=9407 RepID=UPI00078760DA|nr:coatomer subunit zeta-1 isoform X2 [Rousettus aegyptiacus]